MRCFKQQRVGPAFGLFAKRTGISGLVLSALAVSVASVSYAEETGRKIEEVIVTAERREASIQDT